jgi:hypothetical protein
LAIPWRLLSCVSWFMVIEEIITIMVTQHLFSFKYTSSWNPIFLMGNRWNIVFYTCLIFFWSVWSQKKTCFFRSHLRINHLKTVSNLFYSKAQFLPFSKYLSPRLKTVSNTFYSKAQFLSFSKYLSPRLKTIYNTFYSRPSSYRSVNTCHLVYIR